MKEILAVMVLVGMIFAGQIVSVGETLGDESTSGPSGADDMHCYNEYGDCVRAGCAAAGGQYSEMTQGCYDGDMGKFSEAVGKCADAQSDCIKGVVAPTQVEEGQASAASENKVEGQLCGAAFVLLFAAGILFSRATE